MNSNPAVDPAARIPRRVAKMSSVLSARCCSPAPSFCSRYLERRTGNNKGTCRVTAVSQQAMKISLQRAAPLNGSGETKQGVQEPHVWIWLLRLVPIVGSLTGMRMYSLLLAITTLLRPDSTVPTSSAVNSANSWKPAGHKGQKRVT